MQTQVHTISGFMALRPTWRLWLRKYPNLDDGWERRELRLGPVLLSWSHAIAT